MSLRSLVVVLLGFAAAGGGSGCNSHAGPPAFTALPVRVTCTTTIVADVAQRVGGDRVQVETLMGAGVDPHKYISGSGDRKKLDHAHLVFFNGLHLEGKMADLFDKNHDRWRARAVAGTIPHDKLRTAEVDGGEHDPHVWFDVPLWKSSVGVVRDALSDLDPAGAEVYKSNAAAYLKELDDLDREVRAKLEAIPKDRRVLVTSHDAFGYFGRAYGFEVIGLEGVSTASELGTPRRNELATLIGTRRIPAVFTETSVPPVGLQGVLDDVRAKYQHEVKLIGGENALYSDALGGPGTPGATYPGMVRHNVGVIAAALAP
jgi:manganese/zinc/iron transport system substrate-binding protein